jgi:hypothetical protein
MLWVEKALSGKSSERVITLFLEDYHDSGRKSFYFKGVGSAFCLVRAGLVEDQDRFDMRSLAKAQDPRGSGAKLGVAAQGAGQGEETFRLTG